MLMDKEWRLDQLKFLFTYGLCEMPNVGIDLARKYLSCYSTFTRDIEVDVEIIFISFCSTI